jgi:fructose-1,6-bisphosphatase/inositol monophosphatase family enzyme
MSSGIDPQEFVAAMKPALFEAAQIARRLQDRVVNHPKFGEASDVKAALTEADTAAQEALLRALHARFARVRLEAEEDTPTVQRFGTSGDETVVIDPIDGTLRFYLEQTGPYAIMVGLAFQDRYVAALIALPRENQVFDAVQGSGARAGIGTSTQPIRVKEPTGNRVFVSHNLPEPIARQLRDRGYEVCPASGGAISVAPLVPGVCGGVRIVSNSPAGVSIRGRIGVLIAREAGSHVRARDAEFPETLRDPASTLIVGANPKIETDLLEAVRGSA